MSDRRVRPSRTTRRVLNNIALGTSSLGLGLLAFVVVDSRDPIFRASMATAYVSLALFAVTVAFGPLAALRGERYPVSADLRRDCGIWCALAAITHVVLGLQVHLRGRMWEYFVEPGKGTLLPRIDPFGAANYAGLVAALILVALLATSNDVSLRRLGTMRWRRLHALTTWALILTLVHAALYQLVEQRAWGYVVLLLGITMVLVYLRIVRSRDST